MSQPLALTPGHPPHPHPAPPVESIHPRKSTAADAAFFLASDPRTKPRSLRKWLRPSVLHRSVSRLFTLPYHHGNESGTFSPRWEKRWLSATLGRCCSVCSLSFNALHWKPPDKLLIVLEFLREPGGLAANASWGDEAIYLFKRII